MNENNLSSEAKEAMKQGFESIFLSAELAAKEAGNIELVTEALKMIYCTLKGDLTDPETYTKEGLLNLLCENPESIEGVSILMREYLEQALKEGINQLNIN